MKHAGNNSKSPGYLVTWLAPWEHDTVGFMGVIVQTTPPEPRGLLGSLLAALMRSWTIDDQQRQTAQHLFWNRLEKYLVF